MRILSRFAFGFSAVLVFTGGVASSVGGVEIPKPVINIPKPNIPRPTINVPRPNVTVNVPKPTVNVPKPVVNVQRPTVVVPKTNVPKPTIAVTVPKGDVPHRTVDVPKVEVTRPAVSVTQPKISLPKAETTKPVGVVEKANANPPQPIINDPAGVAPKSIGESTGRLVTTNPPRPINVAKPARATTEVVRSPATSVLSNPNDPSKKSILFAASRAQKNNEQPANTEAGQSVKGANPSTAKSTNDSSVQVAAKATANCNSCIPWDLSKDGPVPPGLLPYVYYVSSPVKNTAPTPPTTSGGYSYNLKAPPVGTISAGPNGQGVVCSPPPCVPGANYIQSGGMFNGDKVTYMPFELPPSNPKTGPGSAGWDTNGNTNVYWTPFPQDQAAKLVDLAARTGSDFATFISDRAHEATATIFNGVNGLANNPMGGSSVPTEADNSDQHAKALQDDLVEVGKEGASKLLGDAAGEQAKQAGDKLGDLVKGQVGDKAASLIGPALETAASKGTEKLVGVAVDSVTKPTAESPPAPTATAPNNSTPQNSQTVNVPYSLATNPAPVSPLVSANPPPSEPSALDAMLSPHAPAASVNALMNNPSPPPQAPPTLVKP